MKKIYLLLAGLATYGFASAQTFVSTKVENKNVVLEEFTGIYCQFCPDGHKRANEMKAANPDKVVLINVHVGGYAAPQAGAPDFRTIFGEAIVGQTGLKGYPAGTINRRVFEGGVTALNRGSWAMYGSNVMNETSPVNVDFKSQVNLSTREITITVEAYYTSSAANRTNNLNIAILQDNLTGPQTGAATWYPEMLNPDGTYNHNHMLRHLVTGQWGDQITETTEGSFFTKTYTYKAPAAINGVPFNLADISIAAFITENTQNVITGVSHHLEFPAEVVADLAIEDATVGGTSNLCMETIKPAVKVTNNGPQAVTSFNIAANSTTKTFTGNLAVGQSTTIEFDEINLPGGEYSITIGAPKNMNEGKLIDTKSDNNRPIAIKGLSFIPDAFTKTRTFNFDDGTLPTGVALDLSMNDKMSILKNLGSGNSMGCIRVNLHSSWGMAGKPVRIVMGQFNITNTQQPALTFKYAYSDANFGGTPPQIEVEITHDCGNYWQKIHTFTPQQTGNPTSPTAWYMPGPNNYIYAATSLVGYSLRNAIIRVNLIPGTAGNALYIDDLSVADYATSVEENGVEEMSIFPNPTSGNALLVFSNTNNQRVSVDVLNQVGQVVSTVPSQNLPIGTQQINLNTEGLTKGVYFVRVSTEEGNNIQRLVIQ